MAFEILFVCTGNTCRSPMAEALLKSRIPAMSAGKFAVSSAGIAAMEGGMASAGAVEALAEINVDMSGHRSRPVSPEILDRADLILAMDESHKSYIRTYFPAASGKTYLLSEYADRRGPAESIADPMGSGQDSYSAVRDKILKYVAKIAEKIR